MTTLPPESALPRLQSEKNIWFASVRPDGRPHLAPVWFVWLDGRIYIGTDPKSVKIANIRRNGRVTLALEEGTHPLICEGLARLLEGPLAEPLKAAFFEKYEWKLDEDPQYSQVVEITPNRWLSW